MDQKVEPAPPLGRTAPAPVPTALPPPTRARRKARWLVPLVTLLLLGAIGYAAWRFLLHPKPNPAGRAGAPPQPVGVATIATANLTVTLTGLGSVTPLATVTIKTQINGQLQSLGFTEGQLVHKGDFLAQIDPRPYQVALEQAQGTLAKDTALLNQAKADNARFQTLSRQDSISRQQVEDQVFLIKQYQGAVITDQAAIDSANLNLTYCHIVSPVDGRVGIRAVDVGNYLQTSDASGIVVVTQLQPISVLFTLPEDDVAQVQAQMAAGLPTNTPLQVQAFDRADAKQVATGLLATTDNQVDPTTGTIRLRALFPNADNLLFPQQFVNAHLLVQTLQGVTATPNTAIQQGAPGTFVYLVQPNGTVKVQPVKTGVVQGPLTQVTDGLKPGDQVVTDGLDRLRDGARITIIQPNAAPNAAPNATTPAARPARAR